MTTPKRSPEPRRAEDAVLRKLATEALNKVLLKLVLFVGLTVLTAAVTGTYIGGRWVQARETFETRTVERFNGLEASDANHLTSDSLLREEMRMTRQEMALLRNTLNERLPSRIAQAVAR